MKGKKSSEKDNQPILTRLNKFIADAGIASRRKADELISAGKITINGKLVTDLGYKVKPGDKVCYKGKVLTRSRNNVYILLNKPKDYITTTTDPQERKTIMELVKNATTERVFPVGRLDRNTTGVLLLTNDGDLAQKLTHPSTQVKKVYSVELNKAITAKDLEKLANGIELEDGFIQPDQVAFPEPGNKKLIGIEIHSGKNRIIRRIFEELGYEVVRLDRVLFGTLTKKTLNRGEWRILNEREIRMLKQSVGKFVNNRGKI